MTNLIYYLRFKTEIIYLWEDEEQVYVKSTPAGYYAKFPGGKEYPIDQTTNIVTRAIHAKWEVTKEVYDKGVNQAAMPIFS